MGFVLWWVPCGACGTDFMAHCVQQFLLDKSVAVHLTPCRNPWLLLCGPGVADSSAPRIPTRPYELHGGAVNGVAAPRRLYRARDGLVKTCSNGTSKRRQARVPR
jgi:hypothetical protein